MQSTKFRTARCEHLFAIGLCNVRDCIGYPPSGKPKPVRSLRCDGCGRRRPDAAHRGSERRDRPGLLRPLCDECFERREARQRATQAAE